MPTITAAQQCKAIAFLRWAIFRNGLRRKGGAGELVARIIGYPLLAVFIVGPTILATGSAYAAVTRGSYDMLPIIFWAVFALSIVTSLNISPPGLSFDPESLIRFPLSFSRYLTVRVFFGLLSASTILSTLCLLGAAVGITIAQPALALAAFAAALSLALCNMFFIRMVFAWVDRWLSTRRARELFTGLIIVFSIGIQYLNFAFNPGFNHSHHNAAKIAAAISFYHKATPFLSNLPPALAGRAIASSAAGSLGQALLAIAGILLFAALFLAVFGRRMNREYRGENLSATTAPSSAKPAPTEDRGAHPLAVPASTAIPAKGGVSFAGATEYFSPVPPTQSAVILATLHKEWLYVRRNTAQLYGLLAPLAMVFIIAGRFGASMGHSPYLFPAAVAYSTLGISALAYNSFGLDAAGVQFYFLAPIRLGNVLIAKNLFLFGLNAVSVLLILGVILYNAGMPPLPTLLNTLTWLMLATLVNVTIGNMRSITAPKKIDPSKLSRKQASQLSALMSLGIVVLLAGLGGGLLLLADSLRLPWLPLPILLAFAVAAFALYRAGLDRLDALAFHRRETLIEELCKAT